LIWQHTVIADSFPISAAQTLALVTAGLSRVTDINLRLCDARTGYKTYRHIPLKPFTSREKTNNGEITRAVFSPDGNLLALARNDNETHMYDPRYLSPSRGPIWECKHTYPSQFRENNGCIDAVWVQSTFGVSCGLITGGADGALSLLFLFGRRLSNQYYLLVGCVRLWDVTRWQESILAVVKDPIATFSVGNVATGEHALIVYVYGTHISDCCPLAEL
jgi:WD40 repeat protein